QQTREQSPDFAEEALEPRTDKETHGSPSVGLPEENPPPRERTRFMDSAERRTEKDHPRSQPLTTSSISDADISFPREEPQPPVPEDVSPPELVPPERAPEPVERSSPPALVLPIKAKPAVRPVEDEDAIAAEVDAIMADADAARFASRERGRPEALEPEEE